MEKKRAWIPYAACGVVFGMLAIATQGTRSLSDAFAILAGISGVGMLIHLFRLIRRDPYDLKTLESVQEKAELDALEVPDAKDYDSIQCLCCQRVYSNRFPVCPHCNRLK